MNEKFDEACHQYFCNGLLAAVVTDRDGVVILKSIANEAIESLIDPTISTMFAVANNQASMKTLLLHLLNLLANGLASKLGLAQNKKIVSVYDQYQLIQSDKSPLIITLITEPSANTGLFVRFSDELSSLTEPFVEALNE
ncbi:hypothetical protein BDF20DRAFT_835592 [Mycotypha africana]|uniref:uncharacterized protein n=1 Tax=Mycotypha africana TaxID=64632 RepID=UPI002301FCD8|nr:uncharacterized protein BDF20DRAFT_835592 [Mycotypha africana]KAI8979588.1 hypothetical protein BDF20DRAFT_835592 [Mycotypha africana]